MNNRLRSVFFSCLLTLGAFSAITYSSCNEDKCKATVCANLGVCNNGACICPSGYEGPQCEILNRQRFLGIWQVTEDGTQTAAAQYGVSIDNGSDKNRIVIKNFRNNLIAQVPALVKGDTMYLNEGDYNGYHVKGIGYLTSNKYYGDHGRLVVSYSAHQIGNDSTDYYGIDGRGTASLWSK